jgi:lipid A 3-O-deacylase
MTRFTRLIFSAAIIFSASPVLAGDFLTGYVGEFDALQRDNTSVIGGLEYRYKDVYHGLRPLAGVMVTTDSAVYGYAGAAWDLALSNHIILSPNFAAGGFAQGDGKDLGNGIEFRSGIELAYQYDNGARGGLAFNHMSNASIGNKNPGAENIVATYSIPLNWAQ